ncbi:phosphate ABC transporter substrate-binding protein, PhoT family [Chitinophaga rupis]|uniref:Phosphate ABC transporter substrate-binding protein, PhoT family n=1 Tax=Chitinophaga rupis TaxID=573321 RepID=A0A1H7Y736_9BACT|nr:substrate-binding domain-containing protein [Chitinophaga rupis]SEM41972.1 phosphate ABC transporter substrate-binding protein, PhoT family [Chitinophaga rupis]
MKYLVCWAMLAVTACSNNQKAIRVKGSDTEVNLAVDLAENFYKVNNNFSVAISGGGSGMGIASLMNRQADIANSSRPLNAEEDSLFKKRGIQIRTVVFAEDATAFIVNKSFPLDSIDVATLTAVLSGKYKTWQPVTKQHIPVNIYGRQSNSGTHSFISKKLNIQFSPDAKEMNGNAQIMEGVKRDASGIGYVGAGYLLHDGANPSVKILKITEKQGRQAVSPLDKKAILEHRYYFQRPLYQFIPAASWQKVSAFIDFEKGPAGQKIIQQSGYYIIPGN